SEEYRVLNTTGIRGLGDSSENIRAGKIIKQARKLDIEISNYVLTQAQKAYDQCYETLSHYCHCI
ncbi:MAG: sulfotransferase family protein, partial [Microcystis sp.]